MDSYCMVVRGTGQHHNNGNKADADKQLKRFVEELRAAGHTVTAASITYGDDEVLVDSGAPTNPTGKTLPAEKKA